MLVVSLSLVAFLPLFPFCSALLRVCHFLHLCSVCHKPSPPLLSPLSFSASLFFLDLEHVYRVIAAGSRGFPLVLGNQSTNQPVIHQSNYQSILALHPPSVRARTLIMYGCMWTQRISMYVKGTPRPDGVRCASFYSRHHEFRSFSFSLLHALTYTQPYMSLGPPRRWCNGPPVAIRVRKTEV